MRSLEAVFGIFLQAHLHRVIQRCGRTGLHLGNGLGIFLKDRTHHAQLRLAFERVAPCRHFVEDATDGEDVAAGVGLLSL